jgi:transcription termination/antitermination protein NusG
VNENDKKTENDLNNNSDDYINSDNNSQSEDKFKSEYSEYNNEEISKDLTNEDENLLLDKKNLNSIIVDGEKKIDEEFYLENLEVLEENIDNNDKNENNNNKDNNVNNNAVDNKDLDINFDNIEYKANDIVDTSVNTTANVDETKIDDDDGNDIINNVNIINNENPNLKWYIVYVRSGYEQKAKSALETQINMHNMQEYIKEILIPSEEVIEVSKGKKKTSTRKFYPGYMLVRMIMNEETWHFIKKTPRIVGFIGNSTNPPSIKDEEVLKITNQIKDNIIKPVPKVSFEEGETVRVTEGPFSSFTGIVEEVKPEKTKLRVLVSIFGRSTPVELEFVQVEKL